MADTIAFKPAQKNEPKPAPPKKYRGAGVMIWMGKPFVFCVIGNESGLMPPQAVFGNGEPA